MTLQSRALQECSVLPKTPHRRPGSVGFSHWASLGLQARPRWVAPTLGTAERGLPFVAPPGFGASASPGAVLAGKRPRALATPRIGCSVTTRKPGPGRSEAAADPGVPLPGCLHPWGAHPGTPIPPKPRGRFPFQPRGPLFRCARSFPSAGSLFSADLFSSFCGETLLAAL